MMKSDHEEICLVMSEEVDDGVHLLAFHKISNSTPSLSAASYAWECSHNSPIFEASLFCNASRKPVEIIDKRPPHAGCQSNHGQDVILMTNVNRLPSRSW
jgi:hypothetical protein